ncbi:non-ribosomal peptide synthetase [Streptomyces adonidis]|uniref:non-ribosomal peptide synthetase n=1 Tax=Streptomyces adonidis TaxID=3231367 RepID=UPI0034DAF8EF
MTDSVSSPESAFPASFAQQRLWFIEQLVPDTAQHHLGLQFRVTSGTVDPQALERAVNATVARHETLRTKFGTIDGVPVQVVADEGHVTVDIVHVADDSDIADEVATVVRTPFDLALLPLIRVALVHGPTETVLLFVIHHIVSDAWSLGVFAGEVTELYRAQLEGTGPKLADLPLQYVDFTLWQREETDSEEYVAKRRACAEELRGAPQFLELPADRPRPPVQTFAGGMVAFPVPEDLVQRLKEIAGAADATLFMILLAAYCVVLARLTGQRDLLVASPTAGRTRVETEPLIGFFANTLVLRAEPAGDLTFEEHLGRMRERCLAAFTHQDTAFEHLVEELAPERQLDHNPLVQVMFALQNAPSRPMELPGAVLEPVETDTATSQFDLTLDLTPEQGGGLTALLQFSSELFDKETAARFAGYFLSVLRAVADDPTVRLGTIGLMDEAERSYLAALGTAHAPRTQPEVLPARVRRVAADHPERVAVVAGDQQWTYAELLGHADAVTRVLDERGVAPGDLVGVCLPRSREMVSALLGVWGARAAYVPLDPEYPTARLEFMAADSGFGVLLTTRHLADRLPVGQEVHVVFVEDVAGLPCPARGGGFTAQDDLAYVIHTSGSTGRPKGVMIEHRNLASLVHGFLDEPGIGPQDRLLALTSLSFDIAGLELFAPLAAGARLVIAESRTGGDPERLHELMTRHGITTVQATPTTWKAYATQVDAAPRSLRQIWCGGEELPTALAEELLRLGIRLYNVYGPTETTIWSTCTEVAVGKGPSIGSPIAGTSLLVVDDEGIQVPIGVPGELWIAGDGVGRGYLGRPDLTAERFVTRPDGTRAYRTGDLVRWTPDGTLRFLGRMDHQVKVRGHRIELGEIDATMRTHPQVSDSLTVVHRDSAGDSRIVTFLVPAAGPAPDTSPDTDRVEAWRGLWNQIYGQGEPPARGDLNLKGWTSSYTKQPLPEEEMRHWVEATVDSIAATGARTFCEIGCGTGMLLLRLAPSSEHFVGIDPAKEAVAHVAREVERRALTDRVELALGGADDLIALADGRRFDCVIINSVAQYFPDEDYLTRTLTAAVNVVSPGGFVFVGDARHHGLAEAFHASVLEHQGLPPEKLAPLARARAVEDEELLIEPGYFTRLRTTEPLITGVQIALKRPGPDNELTRFRYDVLLRVKGAAAEAVPRITLDWNTDVGSLQRLEEILGASGDELVVDGIPNARVARYVRLLAPSPHTDDGPGVTLEELAGAAAAHGRRAHHEWAHGPTDVGSIRTVFHRRAPQPGSAAPFLDTNPPEVEPAVNSPRTAALLRSLPLTARSWARHSLPEHMVPQLVRALPALPLTPNGKSDRHALESLVTDHAPLPAQVPVTGETQSHIHAVWCEVLGVSRLGVTENFFEVGGSSMAIVRVRQELRRQHGIELPMTAFFAHPTIESLAARLSDEPDVRRDYAQSPAQPRRGRNATAQRRRGGRRGGE